MKYISLFAGIGGFDLALNRLGHECVYANDFDKYAAQIYKKHFREIDVRDITTVPTNEIPEHDLFVGGFPCQAFSIAGKRGGFTDTRGTLFFEIARILETKKPRRFLLENVKGLLSHDNGNTFKTIIATLDELGYDIQWQVLNSKNFGVPQNRERVFIIGHLRGTPRPEVFPIRQCDTGTDGSNEEGTQAEITNTIDTRTGSYPKWGQYVQLKHRRQSKEFRVNEKIAETVSSTYGTGGGNTPMIIRGRPKMPYKNGKRELEYTEYTDIVPTLSTNPASGDQKNMVVKNMKIRRLTPIECERLQGFPDGWTGGGTSDSQRYKCLGNAVTVNVIQAIMEKLL